jgi:transcriptional regulator with AAA-type ATPase domain/polyferredoxin
MPTSSSLKMQTQTDTVTFLKGIDIFSSLDESDLEQIAAKLMREKIPAGFPVTEKSLPAVCLYIVLDGTIEVVEKNEEGAETIIGEFNKGEYFGEMSLLTGEPSQEDTRTRSDTEVLVLYKKPFDAMLQKHPALSRHFLKVLSKKLQLAGTEIEKAKSKELVFNRFLRRELEFQHSEFIAGCKEMQNVLKKIETAAANDRPVLITGKRGVGKELAARTIHHKSPRSAAPFIWVNCSLIEKQNWGVEIFGCELPDTWRMGFLEIANGGALLLTHIENLPSAIQCELAEFTKTGEFERPGSNATVQANVRIIATSELDPNELRRHHLHPELSAVLDPQTISVPSLAERKKDFPLLIPHLIEKISRQNNLAPTTVSTGAMEFLMSYDYPNNVDELENILERAAILAAGNAILREHIILGIPRTAYDHHFNLLHLPHLLKFLRSKSYPYLFQAATALFLATIVVFCFWSSRTLFPDLGTLSVWSIWWPSLIIFTFFAARLWCGVCPIPLLSALSGKKSKPPSHAAEFLKRYDLYIMGAGVILIFWVEEVFDMRHSPVGTGILISSIGGGALLSGAFFGRYAWCSHICPLGGMLGTFSKAAVVELRSNANICMNQCKTHACYKGDGYPACPMLQHPLSLDTNQRCKMCFTCLKNCPHRSIRLDLRPVGEELWLRKQNDKGAALFSLALIGVLFPLIINRHELAHRIIAAHITPTTWGFALFYALLLSLGVLIACGFFRLTELFAGKQTNANPARQNSNQFAQALIPLALSGHVAYRLSLLPLGEKFVIHLGLQTSGGASPNIIYSANLFTALLLLLLIGGFASACYVFWRIYRANKKESDQTNFLASTWRYVALAFVFSSLFLVLFLI